MKEVKNIPFDLYGDLWDAYEEAEGNGDMEVVETLDTFGIWNEHPKCDRAFLYKIWRALKGDVAAQADVGHTFYRTDDEPKETQEEYKWLDKPLLAIYWYNLAAEEGYAPAQNDLACLYCPDMLGMRGLARCLRCARCGKECCCEQDIPRADALEAETDSMQDGN